MISDEEVLVVDPKAISEGTCHIMKWGQIRVCVCKEKGQIKIFEIME